MLSGSGGNVGISIGDDGVLIIDSDFNSTSEALLAALKELGGDKPHFILNTHWHGDHTGGNATVGDHASIIAHDNVRKRLALKQPKEALPVVTFDNSLSVHFNGEKISMIHLPGGHTDGDSVVYFEGSKVLHTGDLYFQGGLPFVDLKSGGNVASFVTNVGTMIDKVQKDWVVIPGHGGLSNRQELIEYHKVLVDSVSHVTKMKADGLSLQQAQEEGLPSKFDDWALSFVDDKFWIKTVYSSSKFN